MTTCLYLVPYPCTLTYDNTSVRACSGWFFWLQHPTLFIHLLQSCPEWIKLEQPLFKLLNQTQQGGTMILTMKGGGGKDMVGFEDKEKGGEGPGGGGVGFKDANSEEEGRGIGFKEEEGEGGLVLKRRRGKGDWF